MNQQISSFQFVWLMVWLILGTGILTLPAAFNAFAPYQDGWICVLIMMIVPLVMAVFAYVYLKFAGSQSLLKLVESLYGQIGAMVVKLWFVIWLYICACTIAREFAIFIEQNFLGSTPIYVVCSLIVLPVAYAVHTGFENIARLTVLVSVVMLAALILNCSLITTEIHGSYLHPILQHGFGPVVEASIYPLAFTAEMVVAFIWLPSLRNAKVFPKTFLAAGGILVTMGLFLEFTSILALGPSGMYKAYPVFSAVRIVSIGPFIQRIEPMYVVLVISTVFVKLAVFVHTLGKSINETIRLETEDERSISWYISLAVWSGSVFFFHDETELNGFILKVFPAYTFTLVAILAVICGTLLFQGLIRGHRGAEGM